MNNFCTLCSHVLNLNDQVENTRDTKTKKYDFEIILYLSFFIIFFLKNSEYIVSYEYTLSFIEHCDFGQQNSSNILCKLNGIRTTCHFYLFATQCLIIGFQNKFSFENTDISNIEALFDL